MLCQSYFQRNKRFRCLSESQLSICERLENRRDRARVFKRCTQQWHGEVMTPNPAPFDAKQRVHMQLPVRRRFIQQYLERATRRGITSAVPERGSVTGPEMLMKRIAPTGLGQQFFAPSIVLQRPSLSDLCEYFRRQSGMR